MNVRPSEAFNPAENLAGKCAKFVVSIRRMAIVKVRYGRGKIYSDRMSSPASRAAAWDVPPAVHAILGSTIVAVTGSWLRKKRRRTAPVYEQSRRCRRGDNLTWVLVRTLLIALHIQSARRPSTFCHRAGVCCEHIVTGGCAIKCLPSYPGYSAEFFFARRTSKIHSSYKQFAEINQNAQKQLFL